LKSESYKELENLSEKDLIDKHDKLSKDTVVGTRHYLDELYRRTQIRQTKTMLRYTKWMLAFTIVITLATFINVSVFVIDFFQG